MNQQNNNTTMTKNERPGISRRDVLAGTGTAVTLGSIAAALGACVPAGTPQQESLIGTQCVTVLYPNTDDVTFDFDYYKNSHLTMIMDLYGKSIRRFELRKGLMAPDGSKPPYVATIAIHIADLDAFAANGAKYTQRLIDDVPNFTNVMPVIQTDEIYELAES